MHVTVGTLDEFIDEVAAEKDRVLDRIVRVRIDRLPEQEEEITFAIGFHATTVVRSEEAAWILEYSAYVGSDNDNEEDEQERDKYLKMAHSWRERLRGVCFENDLQLRAGKIEVI